MKRGLIFGIVGIVLVGITIGFFSGIGISPATNIEDNKKENQTSEFEALREREWISSGPFKIDRSKYWLGENIFVQIDGLKPNEIGQIKFLRPINETNTSVYTTIQFDGSKKSSFNQYFKPDLSGARKICSSKDLIGKWTVVFEGTVYPPLRFEIIDQTLPGEERMLVPVC